MAHRTLPPVVNLVNGMLALRRLQGRELAIVGASWLDVALEINLREHFVPSLRVPDRSDIFGGMLRSSASKVDLVVALGTVHPEVIRHVDLVRQVRNEFAHTVEDIDLSANLMKTWLGQMVFTPGDALKLVANSPETEGESPPFVYNGESFVGDVTGIGGPTDEVLFFVPDGDARTPDNRLRRQIYACMIGLLGYGMKPWLERSSEPNGLPIELLPADSAL